MRCAGCNREILLAAGERVGFRDTCEGCGADLHTCTHCENYDTSAYNDCREPSAEWVADRERANRCDWFRAVTGQGASGEDGAREQTLAQLDALFKK